MFAYFSCKETVKAINEIFKKPEDKGEDISLGTCLCVSFLSSSSHRLGFSSITALDTAPDWILICHL